MLHVACCLWDENRHTQSFSRGYDESWVERLHAGFRRNLTVDFRFVCFTDRERRFSRGIETEDLGVLEPTYGAMIVPFKLNEPMILVGLDTVVVGNCNHFAEYCMTADKLALPLDPYDASRTINGVALVPAGKRAIFDAWNGENDMEWLRRYDTEKIDHMWPGQIVSLKAHDVRRLGLREARIVYFHGRPKMPELLHLDWIRKHWLGQGAE